MIHPALQLGRFARVLWNDALGTEHPEFDS